MRGAWSVESTVIESAGRYYILMGTIGNRSVRARGRAVTRLWEGEAEVRRGPKPRLNLDVIVQAGIHVARARGLQGVSMTAVANAAGCAKMALYRHVSDRNDLLAAMVDGALGEPPVLSEGWRQRFITLWDSLLDLYDRDPWILELPAHVDALTPRNAAWINTGLGLFEASNLQSGERLGMALLLTENARFAARLRASDGLPMSDLDHLLSAAAETSRELSPDQYPNVAALAGGERSSSLGLLHASQVRDTMMLAISSYFPQEEE